jgi:hypothetical protein
MLPVYPDVESAPDKGLSAAAAGLSPLVVLGCVQDHLKSISTILRTANDAAFPVQQINLGPVAEFSSKIVEVVVGHHACGQFVPALLRQRQDGEHTYS